MMKITKNELIEKKEILISSYDEIDNSSLEQIEGFISIDKFLTKVKAKYIEGMDLAIVEIKIEAILNFKSTRTLKPTKLKLNEKEDLTYAFTHNTDLEDDSIIEVSDNEISLHDEIVSLVITSIPIKVIGKDDPESFSSDNWEVISEDQYNNRKKSSSAFDVLKDLDVE